MRYVLLIFILFSISCKSDMKECIEEECNLMFDGCVITATGNRSEYVRCVKERNLCRKSCRSLIVCLRSCYSVRNLCRDQNLKTCDKEYNICEDKCADPFPNMLVDKKDVCGDK